MLEDAYYPVTAPELNLTIIMKRSMLLASFLALISWSVPKADAASDFLLELDGIKGESSDTKHPEAIEVQSWSWGVSNSTTTGGGGTTGKVSFSDLTMVISLEKASVDLFKACASGTHIKKAVLYLRKPGVDQPDYYTVTLSEVLVSSIRQQGGGSGTEKPYESLSLSFSRIEWAHIAADGSINKASWDIKAITGP